MTIFYNILAHEKKNIVTNKYVKNFKGYVKFNIYTKRIPIDTTLYIL
jgi:hypothetical protein